MSKPRNPRTITRALNKAGLRAGFIYYTQFGYTDRRTGEKVTEPAYLVSRKTRARHGGVEDLGYIRVMTINEMAGEGQEAMLDQAEAAIRAAGIPTERRSALTLRVPDDEDA